MIYVNGLLINLKFISFIDFSFNDDNIDYTENNDYKMGKMFFNNLSEDVLTFVDMDYYTYRCTMSDIKNLINLHNLDFLYEIKKFN